MESVIAAVVNKMDVPSLLLCVVLYGGWRLAREILPTLKHVGAISASMERMAEDTSELRRDMGRIAERVAGHEVRLDALEQRSERAD